MREGHHNAARGPREGLSRREREVLDLLSAGLGPSEIAREMGITYDTVQAHLAALRTKCGARSTLELAVKSARDGLP